MLQSGGKKGGEDDDTKQDDAERVSLLSASERKNIAGFTGVHLKTMEGLSGSSCERRRG